MQPEAVQLAEGAGGVLSPTSCHCSHAYDSIQYELPDDVSGKPLWHAMSHESLTWAQPSADITIMIMATRLVALTAFSRRR